MAKLKTTESPERASITVGWRGHIFLPADLRLQLGIHAGDDLVVRKTAAGGFELVPTRVAINELMGCLRRPEFEGRSLVDELLADRRLEAENEQVGTGALRA